MSFDIGKVVQQVIDEVQAAKMAGLPVELPTHVRFEKDGVYFEIPILRLTRLDNDFISWSYGYKAN